MSTRVKRTVPTKATPPTEDIQEKSEPATPVAETKTTAPKRGAASAAKPDLKTKTKTEVVQEPETPKRGAAKTAAKAEKSPETSKKETKKKPQASPAELREQFIANYPALHASCHEACCFLHAFSPKNKLQPGGIQQQLKKNPKLIYSILLAVAGTIEQFNDLLALPVVHQVMDANKFTDDDVRSTFIDAQNFETRREDKDFKDLIATKKDTFSALARRVKVVTDAIDRKKDNPKSPQEKIKDSFGKYVTPPAGESAKVYDVSAWNDETKTGYKTAPKPTPRSTKRQMKTYPICCSVANLERVPQFLAYLGLDPKLASECDEA